MAVTATTAGATWAAHYATPRGVRHWPCEELVRYIGDRRFGAILEAGCGAGGNLWYLADHADAVVGVDFEPEALAAADRTLSRRGARARVSLRLGDVRTLPLASASVDLVVDCMTAQHLTWADHAPLFAEYRRVLRPGGSLFVYHLDAETRSARGAPGDGFDCAGLALFPSVPFFCLPTPEALAEVIAAAGFIDVVWRGLIREYPDRQRASYSVLSAEVSCASQ